MMHALGLVLMVLSAISQSGAENQTKVVKSSPPPPHSPRPRSYSTTWPSMSKAVLSL
jgi:hypothetical protein